MKPLLMVLLICSGWVVAGASWVYFIRQADAGDARDAAHQESVDMQQVSFFLWDYAQKHHGTLPSPLDEGLSEYGAVEPFAGIFKLLTPKADLFSLPGSTPVLEAKYAHFPGYKMVMYACGQVISRPIK